MPQITETIGDRFTDAQRYRALALATHLECRWTEIEPSTYSDDTFEAEGGGYMVLTEEEANDAWNASLESYIDECINPEIPDWIAPYFDHEAWKRDARFDGRGHCLSPYDGEEHEVFAESGPYYLDNFYLVYRVD